MKKSIYVAETVATFAGGLAVMLLIVVSASGIILGLSGYEDNPAQLGGASDGTNLASAQTVAQISRASVAEGVVAGAVDESTQTELVKRNQAASWLASEAEVGPVYRDNLLDRTAQNHARRLAQSCSTEPLNDWALALGLRIDEGFVESYAESAFGVNSTEYLSGVLPPQTGYDRLFYSYDAFGVGVADVPPGVECSAQSIVVYHLAGIN